MRSRILIGLVTVASLVGGASMGAARVGPAALAASPQTQVCGQITSDTNWTLANSPYEMTCNVGIPTGVTLTIQPGVVVYAGYGAALQVQGKLLANGTATAPITFDLCNTNPV